jgi:Rrf2 family protein
MLRASRKLVFAIEALLDIAYNTAGEPVQSAEITRRQDIPKRYLEPVMQQLVRSGILESVRGARGGYRLARERARITLGDIVRVVRSMETAPDVIDDPAGSILGHKVVRPLFSELQDDMMDRLDRITLHDLCGRARGSGIESEAGERIDFVI